MENQQQQKLHCIDSTTHLLEQFPSTEIHEQDDEKLQFFDTQLLENKIPFLKMLQQIDSPPKPNLPLSLTKASSFTALIKLQHSKNQPMELESCIIHDTQFEDLRNPYFSSCIEGVSSELINNGKSSVYSSSPVFPQPQEHIRARIRKSPRRKRKQTTRVFKNKEEVENQRMTHIAVERNRRRQMNDRLLSLRSLMPHSYIERGDQASIIGGAIDFVKELEQLLQSLQSHKRLQQNYDECLLYSSAPLSPNAIVTCTSSNDGNNMDEGVGRKRGGSGDGYRAENRSETAYIEATVVQTHVNLKIQCERKHGQLLRIIVALEQLRLTALHLNITSFQSSVLYSFNLKIEEDCEIGSAERIVGSVHEIFNYINGT